MSVSIVSRPITSLRGTDVTDLDSSSALVINDWSYSGANKYGVSISSSTVKSLYIENSIDFKSALVDNVTGIITLNRPASATADLQLYWPTAGGTLALEAEVAAAITALGGGSTSAFGLTTLNVFTPGAPGFRNVFRKTAGTLTLTSSINNVVSSTYATNVDIGNMSADLITLSPPSGDAAYYVAAVQILPPTLTITVGTGATFTVTASAISGTTGGVITSATVQAGGTGYAVNDLLSVITPLGSTGSGGVLKVTTINATTTAVTAVTVATAGSGYVNGTTVATVSQMASTIKEASTLHFTNRDTGSSTATKSTIPYKTSTTGTATNAYVLKISQNSAAGFTNAYGAYVTQPSGATNNYALTLDLMAMGFLGTQTVGNYKYFSNTTLSLYFKIGLNIYSRASTTVGSVITPAAAVIEFPIYNVGASEPNTTWTIAPTNLTFKDSVSFVGTDNSTANLFTGTTAKTINIGTGATGTASTNILIGSSTGFAGTTGIYGGTGVTLSLSRLNSNTTTNIATQQTSADVTKTIAIGSGGLAGSVTNIIFGTNMETESTHPTETFLFGTSSTNDRQGKLSFSSTNFGTTGSSQFSIYVLSAIQTALVTDAGTLGNTILTSDEGAPSTKNQVYIPSNSVCSFEVTAIVSSLDGVNFRTALAAMTTANKIVALNNIGMMSGITWGTIKKSDATSTSPSYGTDCFSASAFVEIAGIASCDSDGKVTIQKITKQSCSRAYLSLLASTTSLSLSTRTKNTIQIAGNGIGVGFIPGSSNSSAFSAYAGKYDANGAKVAEGSGVNQNYGWAGSNSFQPSTDSSNTGLLTIGGAPWVKTSAAANTDGAHIKNTYAYEDPINRDWESGWSKEISTLKEADYSKTGVITSPNTYATGLTLALTSAWIQVPGYMYLSWQGFGTGLFHGAYGGTSSAKTASLTVDGSALNYANKYTVGPESDQVAMTHIPYGSGTLVRCPQYGLGLGTIVLYQKTLDLAAGEVAGGKGRYVIYPKPSRDLFNIKMFAYTVPYMKWTAVVKVTECN